MTKRVVPFIFTAAFVAAIVLANWLTDRYGFISVGFGLSATAGTLAAGATFSLRDNVQDAFGRAVVLTVIVVGALISWWISSPALAVASGAAFLISEVADLCVYEPLRSRQWDAAVILSGLVGAVVDSIAFLWIAFGREAVTHTGVTGQVVGKMWMVLAVWLVMVLVGARRQRRVDAGA